MKKFKDFTESKKTVKNITIKCNDHENTLEDLINYIKSNGNIGHSFAITVDEGERKKTFHWDGDGSDFIDEVKSSTSA